MSSKPKQVRRGRKGSQELPPISKQQVQKTLRYIALIVGAVILFQFISPGDLWSLVIFRPMLNALLFLYKVFGHSMVWSIVVFTVAIRLLTFPLTLKQLRSTRVTQELQPELEAIRKKYANDKDKQTQATMKLYKEKGVNPMGGCLPMLIQFPVWIGLYQSIIQLLSADPLQFLKLAQNIYLRFPSLSQLLPLKSTFLWMDLGKPDPYWVLPILVAATMWVQQKMMSSASMDPQQASMNQSMQLMMPIMFGWITLQYAAGLALYFVVSNLVGIITQYAAVGAGGLLPKGQPTSGAVRSSAGEEEGTRGKGKDVSKEKR